MSIYLVGDIHGCYYELKKLLKKVKFNSSKDVLWITGDLVARGTDSLKVLRYIKKISTSAKIVLGNHDLNLISIYSKIRHHKQKDKLKKILLSPDAEILINWLRKQPLLQVDNEKKIIMSHAGITPQWDLKTAIICAKEVEKILSSNIYPIFLQSMYVNTPNTWSSKLKGLSRLCFSTNVLTRMRYCWPDGRLNLEWKGTPEKTKFPLKPWFNLVRKIPKEYTIIFGHWSSLEGKGTPKNTYCLDTGCCWGKKLTLMRWEDKKIFIQKKQKK